MQRNLLFSLALLVPILFAASALHAGYKLDPWGSKTWTGPDRPPHWSPKPTKTYNSVTRRQLGHPDHRIRQPSGYNGKSGYWQDKHNRWQNHRYRRPVYIYYRNYPVRKLIIEREKRIPVIISVPQNSTRLRCAGNTITRKDLNTGEMVIEYITSARDC